MNQPKKVSSLRSPIKSFTRYLVIAMASITVMAFVQFLFLNHMPGWETSIHGMSNQRMINFRLIGDGSYAVAEYYAFESSTQEKIDLSLSILDVDRGQKFFEVKELGLSCARVSPDLQSLALGYRDGTVKIRKLNGSEDDLNLSHASLGRPVREVHWSPDATRLLLGFDTCNEIVDLSGVVLSTISTSSIAPIVCPEDSNYFCLANQGHYRLYDWQSGREVAELPIESSVRSLTFSSDLRYCACLRGCDLMVFDLVAWKSTWKSTNKSPWSTKSAIAFSPDERSLAMVYHDETYTQKVLVFDIESECEISSHEVEMDFIAGIEFANERLCAWTTSGKVCHLLMKQYDGNSKFTVLLENATAFQ